eukprot:485263_1
MRTSLFCRFVLCSVAFWMIQEQFLLASVGLSGIGCAAAVSPSFHGIVPLLFRAFPSFWMHLCSLFFFISNTTSSTIFPFVLWLAWICITMYRIVRIMIYMRICASAHVHLCTITQISAMFRSLLPALYHETIHEAPTCINSVVSHSFGGAAAPSFGSFWACGIMW